MMKAKMSLLGLSIGKIKSTANESSVVTEFELRAKLKVSKRKAGSLSGEGIDSLQLEWIETIDWFEFTNKKWVPQGTDPVNKDLYAFNQHSNTFRNWNTVRYLFASFNEAGNTPPLGLTKAVALFTTTDERDKAAKHWIADNGCEWAVPVATDRPALGLKPTAGSSGGAGASRVTSNSRRRVIYFNLGFKGTRTPRATATLIQESMNGKATLNKFFVPAITKKEADDEKNLEKWRKEFR